MNTRRKVCSGCGRPGHDQRTCKRSLRINKPFDPWSDLEWEEHLDARRIVAANPDGMTLEQVGEVLGVTRERVRQIESAALEKLRSGDGLFEAIEVDVDGVTIAIALVECSKCGLHFPREGRIQICIDCTQPEGIKRKARSKARPPRIRNIEPKELELPERVPDSTPPLGGFLALNMSWGD